MRLENSNSEREVSFDLLRIFAMFMVVFGHGLLYTGILYDGDLSFLNNVGWLLRAFCVVAVNEFFLLTGYFGDSKYRSEKIIKFWLLVETYSVFVFGFSCLLGITQWGLKSFLFFLFPITTKSYWYITVYVVLYLLKPYLNNVVQCIDKKSYLKLLGILLFFFCLHPTFIPVKYGLDDTGGYGVIWAISMYFIGAYIRKFGLPSKMPRKRLFYLFIYVVVSLGIFLTEIVIMKYGIASGADSRGNFYTYNSLSVCISSISLFIFFYIPKKKADSVTKCKCINKISIATIDVYLFHMHPVIFMYVWKDTITKFKGDGLVILAQILIRALIIFVIGISFGIIRLNVCSKIVKPLKHGKKIQAI